MDLLEDHEWMYMQSQNLSDHEEPKPVHKSERISEIKESDIKSNEKSKLNVKSEILSTSEVEIGTIEFVESKDDIGVEEKANNKSVKDKNLKVQTGENKTTKRKGTDFDRSIKRKADTFDEKIVDGSKKTSGVKRTAVSQKPSANFDAKKRNSDKLTVKMDFHKSVKNKKSLISEELKSTSSL